MGQTTSVTFTWGYEKSLTVGQSTITLPNSPMTGEADIEVSARPVGLFRDEEFISSSPQLMNLA